MKSWSYCLRKTENYSDKELFQSRFVPFLEALPGLSVLDVKDPARETEQG